MTEQEWAVAPEVAEIEFARFVRAWRIDADMEGLDDEDVKSFNNTKRRVVCAIQSGILRVDDTGEELLFIPEFPAVAGIDELKMRPPTGAALTKWDKFKEKEQVKKINATMGDICKCNPAIFSKMDMRDLKVVQAVCTLFLVS
jgi:hypothetical protein